MIALQAAAFADLQLVQQIALGAETTAVDAKYMAQALGVPISALNWGTKYWTSGSGVEQSSTVQEAFNASAGKALICPGGDVIAKGIVTPHAGIQIRGVRQSFPVSGLGTRFMLPDNCGEFLLATDSYVSNTPWVNYGPDIDGVCFDGRKSMQSGITAPEALIVLRCARARLGRGVHVGNAHGVGIKLAPVSRGGVAAANTLVANEIAADISNCNEQGIWAQEAGLKMSDLYIIGSEISACGGGAVKRPSVQVDRGAGLVMSRVRLYGAGSMNLLVKQAAQAQFLGLNSEITSLAPVDGLVTGMWIKANGYSNVVVNGCINWNGRASADGATWRHTFLELQNAQARIVHSGNSYHSQNYDMTGWDLYAHPGSRVTDIPGESFRCSEPATPHANIRRAVFQ